MVVNPSDAKKTAIWSWAPSEIARAVAANGAPVSVDWSSGGHDGGDQETARLDSRTAAWFDRYLK